MKKLGIILLLSVPSLSQVAAQPDDNAAPFANASRPAVQDTNDVSAPLELPLSALLQEVLSRNPSLAAARRRWEAQQERPEIVGALPDPMLTYGYWFRSVETRLGAMNQRVSASQQIPFPGKLSLAAERARKEALMLMWEYLALERDLILQAKQAYFDLTLVDESRRILETELDLFTPVIRTAQSRYQAGQAVQADVLRAQLALTTIQNRLLDIIAQREFAVARLNALRNRPPEAAVPQTDLPVAPALPPREAVYAAAQRYRQELREAGAEIERDEAALALAKKQKWPDFNIGVDYTQIDDNPFSNPQDNGRDAVMGYVSISIPLWFKKWKAQEREAEQRLAASLAAEENTLNTALAEVRVAWFQSQVQQEQAILYRNSLLPQAEQAFTASRAAYESGRATLIDVLDSERALLALRLGWVATETEFAKALARLERAAGVGLEKLLPQAESEEQP